MRLRLKIGTELARHYDVRGDYWTHNHDEDGRAPELLHTPRVGDHISWQEMENGPWKTGLIDGRDGDLFLVARF